MLCVHETKALFGRTPAPHKMASALASLIEWLFFMELKLFSVHLAKWLLHIFRNGYQVSNVHPTLVFLYFSYTS